MIVSGARTVAAKPADRHVSQCVHEVRNASRVVQVGQVQIEHEQRECDRTHRVVEGSDAVELGPGTTLPSHGHDVRAASSVLRAAGDGPRSPEREPPHYRI
jgi:hypothetical protein